MFATLTTYINDLVEYIKKMYSFIYNNYNYKQIFLLFLVFFTIYFVEVITRINAEFGMTMMPPGLPQVIPPGIPRGIPINKQTTSIPKKKISTTNKSSKKIKRSAK